MAYGGWHQGTAGTTYYRGGSGHGAWPTWSEVQAAGSGGEPPQAAIGEDDAAAQAQGSTTAAATPEETPQWNWGTQAWGNGSWNQGGWGGGSWQWNWWPTSSNAKGDYSDPPAWGGWSSYRLWKKSLIRWNQNTDVPMWRRFEKLSKQLDWDLQGRFEHVPEATLAGAGYLDAVLGILDGLAGEKDASEKRRVVRAALFEGQRKKDETLSQFAVRREQEFAGADRYLTIPSELKAFILEETAGLTRQGVQNLRTLTSGAGDFDKMVGALKTLDVEEEPLTKGKSALFSGLATEDSTATTGDDGEASPDDVDEEYHDQVEAFLTEVDDADEDTALEMLAAFEKEQAAAPEKRRTWKQNKDRKAAAKKDRRVFSRPRLTVSELKERTRCANCGERGHWKAECKKPYRSKEDRGKNDGRGAEAGRRAVAFVYFGATENEAQGNTFVGWAAGAAELDEDEARDMFEHTIPRQTAQVRDPEDGETSEHEAQNALEDTIPRQIAQVRVPDGGEVNEHEAHDALEDTIPREDNQVRDPKGDDEAKHDAPDTPDDTIPRKDKGKQWEPAARPGSPRARDGERTSVGRCAGLLGWLVAAVVAGSQASLFALDPGHAILDIGAAQDLIGKEAFERLNQRLRKQGLRSLRLPCAPPSAHGVGGKATPLFQALIPCILAGVPGVVRVTVIEESIPHLISVGLLEATGAAIDMRRNTVDYQELGVSEPMLRLKSGHRAVDIAAWRGGTFPTPHHVKEEFGLTDGAFNLGAELTGSAIEAYMVDGVPGKGASVSQDGRSLTAGRALKRMCCGSPWLVAAVSLPVLSGTPHMESNPEHKWKKVVTRLLNRRVLPEEPVVSQQCPHPADSVVNGANQYGSWRRCLLCQTKISYVPHRARPKPKAGKAVAYVSEPPPVQLGREKASGSQPAETKTTEVIEAIGKVMAENTHQLQVAMAQCNQQVLQGMAQTNQQMMASMGTVVQTMQAMQVTQQSMVQEVRQVAGGAAAAVAQAGLMIPEAAMHQVTSMEGVAPETAADLSPQWTPEQVARPGGTRRAVSFYDEGGRDVGDLKDHELYDAAAKEGKNFFAHGPGDLFYTFAGAGSPATLLCNEPCDRAKLVRAQLPGGQAGRNMIEWKLPGLRWHLDNLELEGEFDQAKLIQKYDPDLLVIEPEVTDGDYHDHDVGELREKVQRKLVRDFCHRTCREMLQRGRAVMWAAKRLGTHITDDEKAELEGAGGIMASHGPDDQDFLTNDAGIAVKLHDHSRIGWLASSVEGMVGAEAQWRSFAAAGLDEEQVIEEEAEELDQDGNAGAGVGSFPPEEGEGLAQQAHRDKEVAKLVEKLHLNLGHLSKDRMMVMLKAAGAREDVLEYVAKRFECEMCGRRQRELKRRVAAHPRTYTFNRIVAVDVLYVPWRGVSLPVLNIVDHGSHYQVATLIKENDGRPHRGGSPSSEEAWKTFMEAWIRPFGSPEIVLSDAGSEFQKEFATGLELQSVFHHVVDADSPWQNGVAERHGGEVKRRLLRELAEGKSVLTSRDDIDLMLYHLTAAKNMWYTRAGYSPAQLVFGRNPRIPEELLSDLVSSAPGRQAMASDPTNLEGSERAYVQSCIIRQRARELMFEKEANEKLQRAARAPRHTYQQYAAGQWVYVFRRAPQRARWSGPGLVLLHQGTTVWVAMRARLWKCNVDQVRPASSTEALGIEIVNSQQYQELLRNMEGKRAGAVDVAREGSPPEDAWEEPREEEAPVMMPTPPDGDGRDADQGSGPNEANSEAGAADGQPAAERQRRVSIQSTTVPSEGDQSLEDGEQRKRNAEAAELDPILEEEIDCPGTHEAARRAESSTTPSSGRGEEPPARRRSRSPVPPVMRPVLERAQAEHLELMRQRAEATDGGLEDPNLYQDNRDLKELGNARAKQKAKDLNYHCSGVFYAIEREGEGQAPCLVACRSDEFNMKRATPEEAAGFKESDLTEWNNVVGMNAVKIWRGTEARELRRQYAGRILRSRMVRRKKPMPGVGCFKYKSRWCVLGFDDPDGPDLRTFSPTPQAEVINVFFQAALNLGLQVVFGDVTSAFCQGKKLERAAGRLFAEPCPGIDAEPGDLVELLVAVYGLEDAPVCWSETVQEHLCTNLGFRKTHLDPCLYVRQNMSKPVEERVEAMILVEVDDFNVAVRPEHEEELLTSLRGKFKFGKWLRNEADFNGRHVKITDNDVYMHQEKYVLEKLQALELSKGRRALKESLLTEEEAESFRSMLYRVSWLSHQTRPEAAGLTSILSSKLNRATISDVITLNKMIGHLRSTPRQGIRLRRFRPADMCFIGISDAGGVDGAVEGKGADGMIEDPVQGSWLVLASDKLPAHDEHLRVSVLSWRSTKLKRRVTSTLASETLAFSQCLGEIEWMQVLYRDIIFGDVTMESWRQVIQPFTCLLRNGSQLAGRQQQCGVTDAKSLYDALVKGHPASRQDRRNALELAAIIDAMEKGGGVVRWTSHQRMVADMLTKADIGKGNGALLHLLRTGVLHIDDEASELKRRETGDGRARTRAATERLLSKEEAAERSELSGFALWFASKVSIDLGKLLRFPSTLPNGGESECV
ncbi:RE2 [Symbiodinium sp. CCMP2592]|nr:RE2 [Symbiodinium sp. CCMP2592]